MNFRTTRIYRRSLELIQFVADIRLAAGYSFLMDQLRRAAASVPLNYLEGCGRSTVADRRRFFPIAIGSAHEVAAILEVMEGYGLLTIEQRRLGQDISDHLVAMLRRFH